MARGAIALLLHAHLPFVRDPAHDDAPEERWLHEAVAETYIPLLEMLDDLERDRVPVRLTLSLSPTLLAMLAEHRLEPTHLTTHHATLEDVFMSLTGRRLRDG